MKLHPDGTIEGSPQEIMEYKRLVKPKSEQVYPGLKGIQSPLMPNSLYPAITCDSTKEGIYVSKQPSKAVFEDKTFNFRDLTREDKEVILMEYSTKQLLKELEARTGVHKYNVSPEGEVKNY